jgi:hypothetical protein
VARFANSVMFTPVAGGTVDFVVSTAVQGFMTPALAGAPTGVYKYRAESADLSQWEIGEGTYTSGTTTLTRTTVLYNSAGTGTATGQSGAGSKINFTVAPNVGIVQAVQDTLEIENTGSFSATQRRQARTNISAILRGHLSGMALSTAGASSSFQVAEGECADSTFSDIMANASSLQKNTAAWAVGVNGGALDTGSVSNTWYHVFVIKRPDTGVVDVLMSLSATAPTLPTNYTLFRRIGSLKVESSNFRKFLQVGDQFLWDVVVADVNTAVQGTTAISYTLSTPTGVKTMALVRCFMIHASAGNVVLVSSLDESNQAAAGGNFNVGGTQVASGLPATTFQVLTDTSSQVRARANAASTTLGITTYGWLDRRGRDD